MWRALLLAILASGGACSAPNQEPVRTVAAIEVPVRTDKDRQDLVTILQRHAAADGTIHVDNETGHWREFEAQNGPTLPGGKGTIFVGVWRGANDDEHVADLNDMGHPGRAWLTFVKGKDVARATRFRQGVLADITRRWPEANAIPVLADGGVPLAEDLRLSSTGYKVLPTAAAQYGLPKSSPLVWHS